MSAVVTRTIKPIFHVAGDRLRSLRQERRVGLRELARRLGVSATYLSRIETSEATTAVGAELAARLIAWEKGAAL